VRARGSIRADYASIAEAEAALDAALRDWREIDRWSDAWEAPARAWSQAVWRLARQLGPLLLDAAQVDEGRRIAQRPLFVCGAARSGTTLLRDLLDGHPALAVLPWEGKFFGAWEASLLREPDRAVDRHGQEWLRRFANPTGQRPFWLLGRSGGGASPYVELARAYLGWSATFAKADGARGLQPAVALAAAAGRSPDLAALRYWVDKTPGYEQHLPHVWSLFPRAKVIYLLREPSAVIASRAAGEARVGLAPTAPARVLRNLASSCLGAWRAKKIAPAGQFLVVRYEDLAARRAEAMAGIARFLAIDWNDCLLAQTIHGHPAEPNSAFAGSPRRGYAPAGARERLWLALARVCRRMSSP
jgi:hypothetical protein